MNNFQAQGRTYYKRGDYKRAIECFDRAIGKAPSVQLLDNRAACYEKLEDFSTALKDAKKAIQLHREDATGYLRAGKLLMKMEKESVALEIYTHGLKCVKHVGQGYELLRNAHKELMDKLSPPKSVDPMTMLPRELAEVILEYLSFRQRMNACLVSKQWCIFIRSIPNLWRHLDLSRAPKKVRTAFISRAINVGKSKLTAATLNNLWDFDKTITALLKHCPLEELTLLECGLQDEHLSAAIHHAKFLRSLTISDGTQLTHDVLRDTLQTLSKRLETLNVYQRYNWITPIFDQIEFPAMKSLTCKYGARHTGPSAFPNVALNIPILKSLTLHHDKASSFQAPRVVDLSECKYLQDIDFSIGLTPAEHIKPPATTVTLKISSDWNFRRIEHFTFFRNERTGQFRAWYLPRLEKVVFDIKWVPIEELRLILEDIDVQNDTTSTSTQTLSKLISMSVTCADSSPRQISLLLTHPRLKELEELRLPQLQKCDDTTVEQIVKAFPKLRLLDLSATQITGVGVKTAVNSGHVTELVLNDCQEIGKDAIDWAREKGIRVKARTTDSTTGGKKVRY